MGEVIASLKIPAGILVQRSPERCRFSLFSQNPPGSEVIIRKNVEQGPEMAGIHRRESGRSYLATFGRQKVGRMGFRLLGVLAGGLIQRPGSGRPFRVIEVSKEILVQRSPDRNLLYLFS